MKSTKKTLLLLIFMVSLNSIFFLTDHISNLDNINLKDVDEIEKKHHDLPEIYPSEGSLPNKYNFKYYKVITLNHTKVSGLNNFSDFPVLISIFDKDLHDDVQSDGDDIAFANDTSWLDHELELFNQDYNTSHAQLIAWVRVSLLSSTVDTNITMYYGNPYLNSQENSTEVWDNNYKAVWHMKEVNPVDSTSNNNDGTESGGVLQVDDGRIAGANLFMGDDEYISIGNIGSEIKTIEFWMKPSNLGSGGSTETAWKSPTATGDDYNQWDNPTYAFTSDDLYSAESTPIDEQDWYNFNFNVPNGATIDGIQVNVEAMASSISGANAALSGDGGNSYTSEKGNTWTSEQNETYGDSVDTWGRTWSSDNFTNSNFRIKLRRSTHNPGTDLNVDYIAIKVYYTYISMKIIDLNSTVHIDIVGGDLLATNFPSTTTIYIDGVINSSLTTDWNYVVITDTKGVNISGMEIGRVSPEYFDGRIDELRLSNLLRSAELFNTSYHNQYDPKSFYNITQEVSFNSAPPNYSNLTESLDPLELGNTQVITINITNPAGIKQVKIEFEDSNHSMTNIGGDIWCYDLWKPSHTGNHNYTIFMEDNCGNWNSVNNSILVVDTIPPSPPIIIHAPSGEINGTIAFDWEGSFDYSGISYYILIIDNESDPFATPGFIAYLNITNTGPESSYYVFSENLSPGTYYYFLCQIDGVGHQSDFITGSFTMTNINDRKNDFTILNILPYILGSVIASVTVIVIVKRRIQSRMHPQRKKISLKSIISHINKISNVKPFFKREEQEEKSEDKIISKKETIEERELTNRLNVIKALGEELFDEGAYLEAQKQFKEIEELFLKLGNSKEAALYSKMIIEIDKLNKERETKLELLEQENLEERPTNIIALYIDLIDIAKRLNDSDTF